MLPLRWLAGIVALTAGCAHPPQVALRTIDGSALATCAPGERQPSVSPRRPRVEGQLQLVQVQGDDRLQLAGRHTMAFSADGRQVIGANADALVVWDVETGRALHHVPLALEGDPVRVIAAPDGEHVALVAHQPVGRNGARRASLLIVNPAKGTFRLLARTVGADLRFSADGRRLLSTPQAWDVASGTRLPEPPPMRGAQRFTLDAVLRPGSKVGSPRFHVQWLDDGATALELRHDGKALRLLRWRRDDTDQVLVQEPIGTWPSAPQASATQFVLSPNGHFFLAVDGTRGELVSTRDGVRRTVAVPAVLEGAALSNDGRHLAHWGYMRVVALSASIKPLGKLVPGRKRTPPSRMELRLWSLQGEGERWSLPHDGSRVLFSRDDRLLTHDLRSRLSYGVYDVASGKKLEQQERLRAIHPGTGRALVMREGQAPAVVELASERRWPARVEPERVIARSGPHQRVTLGADQRYRLRSRDACLLLPDAVSRQQRPAAVRFAPEGERLYAVARNGRGTTVSAWDPQGGSLGGVVFPEQRSSDLRILPRSGEVVVPQAGHLALVDIATGAKRQARSPEHGYGREVPGDGLVWAVRAKSGEPDHLSSPLWTLSSRDGERLVVPQVLKRRHHLSLWSTRGGAPVDLFQHDGARAYDLSADDQLLAVGGGGSVRWWHLADQTYVGGPKFAAPVAHLRFNADATLLAVATTRGAVHVVHIATKRRIGSVDLRPRFDRARLLTWTGPRELTVDTERGVEVVVAL